MGIFPEGDGIYNFARDGSALPQGQAINRRYAINDYEFFGQDSWRVNSPLDASLMVCAGCWKLRLMKPTAIRSHLA